MRALSCQYPQLLIFLICISSFSSLLDLCFYPSGDLIFLICVCHLSHLCCVFSLFFNSLKVWNFQILKRKHTVLPPVGDLRRESAHRSIYILLSTYKYTLFPFLFLCIYFYYFLFLLLISSLLLLSFYYYYFLLLLLLFMTQHVSQIKDPSPPPPASKSKKILINKRDGYVKKFRQKF